MLPVVMTVVSKGKAYTRYYRTITNAYRNYVWFFATFSEWFYYLICAHKFLCTVDDEKVMENLFRNVFKKATLSIDKEYYM